MDPDHYFHFINSTYMCITVSILVVFDDHDPTWQFFQPLHPNYVLISLFQVRSSLTPSCSHCTIPNQFTCQT